MAVTDDLENFSNATKRSLLNSLCIRPLHFDQHTIITIMLPKLLLCTAGQHQLSRLSQHPASLLQSCLSSSQQSYSSTRQQHTDAPPSGQETRTAYERCAQLVRSVGAGEQLAAPPCLCA